ncbi:hypothetical protein TREMEDRAFT_66144 [Tremella mesenterica DSM 1558]|uniref:uncharacterized protein n=1 Tax=Tremella mesenterica (strain ATCC 24925 / CBS 8224 / DSM 1558 / NBRC 9311 / NRRL Y-6157 / RJB 2259-6 / UBC 559-6) TaxID=578456 RepID=UPI00032C8CBF|nr:uncharacterized protein TREMEDRAFT_66144 [Tremella mesenterica DSM 1558]EIW65772.1 hypothetical protein TREMEDRAFT_66144 [Tremella mesenterica DSM 1558]
MTSTMDARTRRRIMNDLLETTVTSVETALSLVNPSLSAPLFLLSAAHDRRPNVPFLAEVYQQVGMAIGITLTDDPTASIQRSSTSRLRPSVAPTGSTITEDSSQTLTITNLNQENGTIQVVGETIVTPNGKVWVKGEDHTLLWVMYDNNHLSPSTVNNQ